MNDRFLTNYPLLGRKGSAFEGGTRVAALLAGSRIPAFLHANPELIQGDWKIISPPPFAGAYDGCPTNQDQGAAILPPPANDTSKPCALKRI